jgi:hypothetical protein
MQLAVCWPGTHGSQPHAHDDDKKSQRSWASIIMARRLEDVGLALPLCYAHDFDAGYSVRVDQNATASAPLAFVRSSTPGLFRGGSEP